MNGFQEKTADAITDHLMVIDVEMKRYQEECLPSGDYMISCDYHAPYHSEVYVNRLLKVAHRAKIRKHVIIGDLFDMDFAKKWPTDEPITLDKEWPQAQVVIDALCYFDENYLVQGNHESRVSRLTDGKIQAKHLFALLGGDEWKEKFRYTEYDKIRIGDDWLLVHPQSYSQVSPSVAI